MNLEQTFSEEEIVKAIKDCSSFNASGPDGFKLGFIKKAWKILRHDCLEFFFEFHKNGRLVKGLNATFIALIPKVEGPLLFKDFRPIGMVGWSYKILVKSFGSLIKICNTKGILKCKARDFPLTYLGLLLGANPRRINTWNLIVDRFKKKLALWKRNRISIGGRISLIKSALSNLAIYFMSLFKMPITVAQELEKIQR
ncbi:hypothetical protein Acr_00g0099500 [Actinidia rufa]|uniref:Uncharacterized protein n=1 Tax=Actinidia rufa TaxID=165716 RepID=A0A7J0DZJ0_9ERIC|nr:hypothetical protein Acr_00g0099500 [Actinidia rufa]